MVEWLGREGQGLLAAIATECPTVSSSKSLAPTVAKIGPRRVAITSSLLDSGMMKALASEGIAYIKDFDNVFLPFWAWRHLQYYAEVKGEGGDDARLVDAIAQLKEATCR